MKLFSFKWSLSSANFVQKATERPNVGFETVFNSHATFGTHVEGRSDASRRHFKSVFQYFRNPKITQFGLKLAILLVPVDEDVLHFDVSVDDLFVV